MKCQKDECQFLPLHGTHAGNYRGWGLPAWDQPRGKGLGGQGSGREAAVCPGSKGGLQLPGLYDQEHGQEIKGRDSLKYSIQVSDSQFRNDTGKME